VPEEGVGPRRERERDRSAWARAVLDEPGQITHASLTGLARREDHVDDVVLDAVVDVDVAHDVPRAQERRGIDDLLRGGRLRRERALDDDLLLGSARIADLDHEQESIDLRFGQPVGALLLDRVLRRHDDEGLLERVGAVADRDLALLHRLEQRALHLGRSAVDLVGQDEVREDRAELRGELTLQVVVDDGADEIRRQEVRRELHTRELRADGVAERAHRQRLRESGHALEQDVAATEQADEDALDHVGLADDHLADLGHQVVDEAALLGDELVQCADVVHGQMRL
jgi:hypothetical protein